MNTTIDLHTPLVFDHKNHTDVQLLTLYKTMLLPRLIEEKMLILLRQGKISKWFSGIGQEAISVGITNALESDEYILPMLGIWVYLPLVKFPYIGYLRNGRVN